MDSLETPVLTDFPRKRKVNIKNRAREQAKQQRYKRKDLPVMPTCSHKGGRYKCRLLKNSDALYFSDAFYKICTKLAQDAFILSYCCIDKPKRTDRNKKGGPRKAFSVSYSVRTKAKQVITVCQRTFFNVLGITQGRVRNICNQHFRTGAAPTENRGGDRKSLKLAEAKHLIINFIKQYKTIEIHYCRSRIAKRQYLPGELSINRMWRSYNESHPNNTVKSSYFRMVFNSCFNIGFKSHSTDVCSTCLQFKENLKMAENPEKKNEIMTKSRIHKLRAKAFFQILNEERDDLFTMSFDCQKNMTLPKVSDQAAYYSRQLYLYLFGMVIGTAHSSLTNDNVILFYWTENSRPKGSNEIVSAVFYQLCHSKLDGIRTIRLVADGCGGQNKNSIMVGMCQYWLAVKAPRHVSSIELIFPVPGHSYIPPDRVFAQIEKKVKARETLVEVEEYLNIYKEHGTVKNLGSDDCPVLDFKGEVSKFIKPPSAWHFKFNKCKRFIIKRGTNNVIGVRGETFYKSNIGVFKTCVKRGQNVRNMALTRLPLGIQIKAAKLEDVEKLLTKHFGSGWKLLDSLKFYKNILNDNNIHVTLADDEDPVCEVHSEESSLRI